MEFGVLGPLEVTAGGQSLALAGARTRAVLALLLVRANQVVSSDRLLEELWPGQPADRATDSLQVRLSELRKALRLAGEAGRLATRSPGYLLRVEPGELDALRFEQLAAEGDAALAAGDAATATQRFDQALGLWRGPALAGLDAVPSARAEAGRLEEQRLAALESRAEALLAGGRHRDLIAELESLTAAHPLRERFWSLRMLALYRAGRQADALRAYRELRDILVAELAIEPGPELRELHARILRQDPALDGPAARRPGTDPDAVPQTRYAPTADGIHVAYQVLGEGERDIIFVPGLMSHLELLWEDEETAGFFRRLSRLGRLILFDKRDTGLSDPAPSDMSLEERMEDVRAVMRAADSRRAVLFGYSEGAPMSILFAATYPGRVSALILGSASARWFPAPGYPCGQGAQEMYDGLQEIAAHRWGQGASIEWYLQSRADSAARPAAVRPVRADGDQPQRVPADDPDDPRHRRPRRAARHPRAHAGHPAAVRPHHAALPRALPGLPHRRRPLFRAARRSLAAFRRERGQRRAVRRDRRLPRAPRRSRAIPIGCSPPSCELRRSAMVDQAQEQVGGLVRGHRGRLIRTAADGILATFDAPGQAIRCAAAVREEAAAAGIQIRAGIHTGEVDLVGEDIAGISVQITDRVAALARPAEILVSRTVKDLVTGSGITFAEIGSHALNGTSDEWSLFAVTGFGDRAVTAAGRQAHAAEPG